MTEAHTDNINPDGSFNIASISIVRWSDAAHTTYDFIDHSQIDGHAYLAVDCNPYPGLIVYDLLIAAGVPSEAFGFYPTDHEGAGEILRSCGRALIFGDKNTTQQYANNPAIQLHGPGWSKFLIGEDCIENWRDYIDVIAGAISDNGGRSCINASAVVVPNDSMSLSRVRAPSASSSSVAHRVA